jgi:hypothetical protein
MPVIASGYRLAASLALRSSMLLELAGSERDEGRIAEWIALHHPEINMTTSLSGITVRTHGRDELRRVIVEAMSDNRRYRHLNPEVIVDEDDRAVLRTPLLVLQGDRPLIGLPLEWRVGVRDGLISESHGAAEAPEDQPTWAPLGSTLSLGGEILARWGDEQFLARLYDGRPIELPAPEEFEDEWDVGDQLMVFFENEAVVGWYLPDKQLGLDLRDPGDPA